MRKHVGVNRFVVQYVDEDGDTCREMFSSREQASVWAAMLRGLTRSGERITDIKLIRF